MKRLVLFLCATLFPGVLMAQDCAPFDRPEANRFLFHPRPDFRERDQEAVGQNLHFVAADGTKLHAKLHPAAKTDPVVLFFHGNGEVASDYDEIAPFFNRIGLSLMVFEYRGYGRSGGTPTVKTLFSDAVDSVDQAKRTLAEQGFSGPIFVMGRSLGSAAAVAVLLERPQAAAGLIIESGFAHALPLMAVLGADPAELGVKEDRCFNHLEKLKRIKTPLLVIHGEGDRLIPFTDAQALLDASAAAEKLLVGIPGADHNDLFMVGLSDYLAALQEFTHGQGALR